MASQVHGSSSFYNSRLCLLVFNKTGQVIIVICNCMGWHHHHELIRDFASDKWRTFCLGTSWTQLEWLDFGIFKFASGKALSWSQSSSWMLEKQNVPMESLHGYSEAGKCPTTLVFFALCSQSWQMTLLIARFFCSARCISSILSKQQLFEHASRKSSD